jgi:uncharacterized DUF497 family protein
MNVVWDIKKAVANIRNHGVGFSHAVTVLDDPLAVTIEDTRHVEQRFVTAGSDIFGRLLVVFYSYSGEEEIRLISARKATPKERWIYEQKE